MLIPAPRLEHIVHDIFAAAGCRDREPNQIASRLVGANLVGHDSHGVIRVPDYIQWLRDGKVIANRQAEIVLDSEVFSVLDGGFGFGQALGEQAMQLALERVKKHGVAVVGLRNAGHLGRIGDWAEMAASAGYVSLHFVNTSGGGILVAPFGGIDRRLSADPIAAGVPLGNGRLLVLDISCAIIAEGKLKVARNKGVHVAEGLILDPDGQPTTDPLKFYGPPRGAILPFGGHKGYALGMVVEILAGALCGGWCSNPEVKQVANNMLSIVIDPARVQPRQSFVSEVERFVAEVKTSRTVTPDGEILYPGEPEARCRAKRQAEGIPLDDTTWSQLARVAAEFDVNAAAT
ncbi:MAG: malate/lactate/ureidoglycolate dehydrogenase [Pirellulales bacterium]|nr:malate/lactate/ureidoglycolate dehydrogenase [Pirellulales bacterium]